ncbi:MAG: T9SS type A sorting domain-containing protein [Crocinitomix sp.]|nr:T9SS type A sorting domain-containing protein [Crocinitomix sp.]
MNRISALIILLISATSYSQVLNEICPSNVDNFENEDEGFTDWIELWNNTGSELSLDDFYITNDRADPTKWQIESDEELDAGDNIVLSAKEFPELTETIPFSFKRGGGHVYLTNSDEEIIDSIIYPELQPNDSYGRYATKWFYFDTPTPESDNTDEIGYKGYASQPQFNRVAGKYNKGTNITLNTTADSEFIYYSFNGTNPLDGNLYTGPIVLQKTSSIRAVSIGDSLIASPAAFSTYFVDIEHQLPIVNLNLDSLELLDELIGIYVLGPDAEEEYPYFGANFWKDIEIHAYYEYFDTEMVMHEALDCGVKIHGGTVSSTRPMKSLRLVAHDRYEKESFTYPYFDNKAVSDFKRLLLRNSGSDFNQSHLKDGVLHKFVLDHKLNVDAQGYQPVIVYINGLYWGIHNMREKLDKYYPTSNYGVHPETVNLLEEEELIVIAGDSAEFVELRDFVVDNDMTDESNFDWVKARLDVNSMVDYFIMELYVNNRDWPYNNLKLWNSPSHPQWRYFYSDLDAGVKYYGPDLIDFNSLQYILGPYGDGNVHVIIFKKILENPEFQRYFINRYADLMNTILEADYIINYIYKAKEKLDPEMQRHFYKWYGLYDEWNENFHDYDKFFNERVAIVQNELSLVFEKEPALDVFVGMYPSSAGIVELNTIELDSFPFIGKYYPANKIDLTAVANVGETFVHWENLRTGQIIKNEHIQVDPTLGDSLIAIFESNESPFDLAFYPNPLVTHGQLTFSVQESDEVKIQLFNLQGAFIAELAYQYLAKGSYSRLFRFEQLKAGTYFIRVITPVGTESIQFIKV